MDSCVLRSLATCWSPCVFTNCADCAEWTPAARPNADRRWIEVYEVGYGRGREGLFDLVWHDARAIGTVESSDWERLYDFVGWVWGFRNSV